MKRFNILIVDDDEAKSRGLRDHIFTIGPEYVCDHASNGLEGLAKARCKEFDLILLDIHMDKMNGIEFLEHAKDIAAIKDIPVIIVTASDNLENLVRCIELGAEDYLTMPPNKAILSARIRNAIKRREREKKETELNQRLSDLLLEVSAAEDRADDLLHAVFPADCIPELKESDTIAPRRFDDVAVLFTDIVNFTKFSDEQEPEDVIPLLQSLVEQFEIICEANGLEKIKTIGDAFLAVGGLLAPDEEAVSKCVKAGRQMIVAASELPPRWEVRVGIHVGSVVAGMIGKRKFAFDIWGDTVNTAARVQTAAQPSSLYLSSEAWSRVNGQFPAESCGRVALKGKSDMELFCVQNS